MRAPGASGSTRDDSPWSLGVLGITCDDSEVPYVSIRDVLVSRVPTAPGTNHAHLHWAEISDPVADPEAGSVLNSESSSSSGISAQCTRWPWSVQGHGRPTGVK